jgi:hypothetical protein
VIRLYEQSRNGRRVRSTALVVLLSFLLPFVQMAYGATRDPEIGLPACCRSHGKHKCSMRLSHSLRTPSDKEPTVRTAELTEKCPWAPIATSSTDWPHFVFLNTRYITSGHGSSTLLHAGRTPLLVLSQGSANHKRGPPSFSIFA